MTSFPTATEADIGLLLEGTFPFVSGGVSSWVNQIIRSFPEYTFALIFLGSRRQDYGEPKYQLPDNVVHLECHYMHEASDAPLVRDMRGDAATFEQVAQMHGYFRSAAGNPQGEAAFAALTPELLQGGKLDRETFLYSERAWDFIKQNYRKHSTDPSFVDYFWTIRACTSRSGRWRRLPKPCRR